MGWGKRCTGSDCDCTPIGCPPCDVGTPHANVQVVFGSGLTNASCGNCTDINGSTQIVPLYIVLETGICAGWRLQPLTPCGLYLDVYIQTDGFGHFDLWVALFPFGGSNVYWKIANYGTNCDFNNLTVPFFSNNNTSCGGTPASVTLTAL